MVSQTEIKRARQWRRERGLTMDQLSELTGYSVSAIHWFEKGESPPRKGKSGPLNEFAWQRYRMCCEAISRRNGKDEWDWS